MMRIGELSRRTGVTVRSIRHYETTGLLEAVRTDSGQRLFNEQAVGHVQRIGVLLRNGFTIEEIRPVASMLDYRPRSRREICAEVITLYRHKLADFDERIQELQRVRSRVAARLDFLEEQRARGGPDEFDV